MSVGFDRAAFADLYPFRENFFLRDGLRMHFVDEGQGSPVVFVHGNPTWSFYFRELIVALREKHRCIAPDHMGCGLSDKPGDARYEYTLERRVDDLEALLAWKVPTGKVSLVLHDWGGMIGGAWAVKHAERVEKLVILNTAAFRLPATKPLPWTLWGVRNFSTFGAVAVRGLNAFAGLATRMATAKTLPPRVASGLVAPYDSWENRIATLRFVQDIPLAPGDRAWNAVVATEAGLEKLRNVPMLIGWGMKDFVFDEHFLEEWKRRFPNATVHSWKDAGHYVLEDAKDKLVPLVVDFLG